MPATTQLIPNFLGGVSRQIDEKKLLGQVTECINGYPDPTFGLMKRPGIQHTNVLKNADGTAFNKTDLDGAIWFFIERDADGSYIGAIKGDKIYVWTTTDGTFCTITTTTITNIENGTGYSLSSDQNADHFNVATTGGTGTGLTVNIPLGSGSTIQGVTIDNPGTGYTVGDVITVTRGNGDGKFTLETTPSYLTGTTQKDYHFRSVKDVTVITNKTVTTAMQPVGTFVEKSVATLHLVSLIAGYNYSAKIQGEKFSVSALGSTTYDDMLDASGTNNTSRHLVDAIKAGIATQHTAGNNLFSGTWVLEGYATSLVIKRFLDPDNTNTNNTPNQVLINYEDTTNTTYTWKAYPKKFRISSKGGPNNLALESFQDSVTNLSKLPVESFNGHNVKIINSTSEEDDYHLKFFALDGEKGEGYWQESVARDASPGLVKESMPHQLSNIGPTEFTFSPLTYTPRNTGDDVTSTIPSFIGFPIQSTFFYSNRFGMLSEDNIIFSTANDPFNFFVKSATTQIDSDPIDLNVASIRPVKLSEVLPSPQGLLLFSERQQFQVYASDSSILTPTTSIIKDLSNYETNPDIAPVEIGTTTAFVTKVPGYSKLFIMQLRDVDQGPLVTDISKVVLEWIPENINKLTVSSQNSIVMLVDNYTSYLYIFKYFNNGEKDLFQAWTKWKLPGIIQTADIINDSVFIISQHENEYTLGRIILDETPSGSSVSGATTITGNTCLDMATRPVSPTGIPSTLNTIVGGTGYTNATNVATTGGTGTGLTVDTTTSSGVVTAVSINTAGTGYTTSDVVTISGGGGNATVTIATLTIAEVVYDSTNEVTKIYVPYTPFQNTKGVMLLTVPTADVGTDAAVDADAGFYLEATERTEIGTGYHYFEVKGDYSSYADGIVVGYNYDFETTLPKLYYKKDPNTSDYTATLTISRVTFSLGRTGPVLFKIKADGSDEWNNIEYVTDANIYKSDSSPVTSEHLFTIPIHQRNTNFKLKVTSNFPYPVSLVSMTWEGNYSPRFYRRA